LSAWLVINYVTKGCYPCSPNDSFPCMMTCLSIDPPTGVGWLVGCWIHSGSKSLVGGGHQKPPLLHACYIMHNILESRIDMVGSSQVWSKNLWDELESWHWKWTPPTH
jgi:hypothetical protein